MILLQSFEQFKKILSIEGGIDNFKDSFFYHTNIICVVNIINRGKPPRPRRRSKSASSRVRHYSPDGRRRAKYIVKEFYTESSSAESDDDVVITRYAGSLV